MSIIGAILESMKAALALAAPTRTVTRHLRDFAERSNSELAAGVFTLIHRGQPARDDDMEFLDVLLVGQVLITEADTGDAIEEAELLMLEQVKCFVDNISGAQVRLGQVRHSMQIEKPYGWISVQLRVGPLDLSCLAATGSMDSFIRFHAEYDATPDDPTDNPIATDDVTLPQ
jgi:hypothetical protein